MSASRQATGSPTAASLRDRLGYAWLMLTLALAVHVLDEADNDFLAFYNPLAASLRARITFLPLPVFTFAVWLTGLAIAVSVLLALSPLAFRGGRWARRAAFLFAGLMAANAVTHFAGTLRFNQVVPGTWSAPVLLLAAAWLYVAARRATPGHRHPLGSY